MKRLFILIAVCMIGMVVPQGVFAAATEDSNVTFTSDGSTITITSTKAGALAGLKFVGSHNQDLITALSNSSGGKIVFVGDFNEADLKFLNGQGQHNNTNYCNQKIVDMSDAKFVGNSNGSVGYAQMKFNYWSNTLTKAITSQYADNSISNDIFQNCKSLTNVEFLSGTVKGFNDHKKEQGYAEGLSVTIGKNVTSIADGAFQRCDVLSSVTFDKDYSGGETPKDLTIGQEAFESCSKLSVIEFPNRVTSIGNSAFKNAGTSVDNFAVSFERRTVSEGASVNYDVDLTIGNNAFDNCTTIQTLSLPIRLKTMGDGAFAHTSGLTTVEIREDVENARLTTIPNNAFLESGITSIKIPRSVTRIKGGDQGGAFQACHNLENIWFQESHLNPQPDLVIEKGAFAGGNESLYKLKNVYVDIDPSKRKLICEYDAFPFVTLDGQTDVTNTQKATLHFNEKYWYYYAGDWKRGLSFDTQEALNSIKDGCRLENGKPRNGHFDKIPNYVENNQGYVSDKMPANGWQQFAVTSTGIDIIIPPGEFIRTYSTSTAYDLPEHVRIFRVINFDDGYKPGQVKSDQALADAAKKTAITKEVTGYIPKNTGLIMVGNVSSAVLYYFKENSGTDQYPHSEHTVSTIENPGVANLLVPTLDNDEFPLAPVWRNDKNEIEYRNFGMLKKDHKFGRAKVTTMRKNYAYLKIPAELFNWSNESENGGSGNGVENTTTNAKISVLYMFDDINEDNFGIATAIKNAINKEMSESNSYYTLQGVKVSKPTKKGVYISNGKKVLVK
jgi:hypothetical protein